MELKELKRFVGRNFICVKELILHIGVYENKDIIKKDDIVKITDWSYFDKGMGEQKEKIGEFAFILKRLKDDKIFKILVDDIKNFEKIR